MRAHTVTVTFDDDLVSMQDVLRALSDVGYTVPEYRQVDAES